jgi:putative endonuclease
MFGNGQPVTGNSNIHLGRRGERRAAWFYRLRGYSIVERNLVVRRGHTVAIVEVKTRQSNFAGEGFDAVDRRKRERLVRLGDQYAATHPGVQLRYDILSLHWNGRRFDVKHFPDAFRPVADATMPWRWKA